MNHKPLFRLTLFRFILLSMPWTSGCPSEGILPGSFADFLTAVLTLAGDFSAFAFTLIDFARRLSFLSAAFSSFNVRVESSAASFSASSFAKVCTRAIPSHLIVFDTLGRRDDPGIQDLSRRILSDPFTPLFDETLHGRAGVTRKAFAQFFSNLLQAFKMSLGLFKMFDEGISQIGISRLFFLCDVAANPHYLTRMSRVQPRGLTFEILLVNIGEIDFLHALGKHRLRKCQATT
jgi:hypothetical protein